MCLFAFALRLLLTNKPEHLNKWRSFQAYHTISPLYHRFLYKKTHKHKQHTRRTIHQIRHSRRLYALQPKLRRRKESISRFIWLILGKDELLLIGYLQGALSAEYYEDFMKSIFCKYLCSLEPKCTQTVSMSVKTWRKSGGKPKWMRSHDPWNTIWIMKFAVTYSRHLFFVFRMAFVMLPCWMWVCFVYYHHSFKCQINDYPITLIIPFQSLMRHIPNNLCTSTELSLE